MFSYAIKRIDFNYSKKILILRIDKKKKKDFKWIDVVKLQMSWKFTFWNIVGLVNDIETVNFMVLVNQNPINLIEIEIGVIIRHMHPLLLLGSNFFFL